MKRLILFLIRKKLGLRKFQPFRFEGQKSKTNFYYFKNNGLMKYDASLHKVFDSHVSLNWILNDKCKIFALDLEDTTIFIKNPFNGYQQSDSKCSCTEGGFNL